MRPLTLKSKARHGTRMTGSYELVFTLRTHAILELGEHSAAAHQEAIRDVMRARPAAFVAVGPEMNSAREVVSRDANTTDMLTAPDSIAAAKIVSGLVRTGDVLLVKGSRGIAMERIIEKLGSS